MQKLISIILAVTLGLTVLNSVAIYHIYDILAKHTCIEIKQTEVIKFLVDEVLNEQ